MMYIGNFGGGGGAGIPGGPGGAGGHGAPTGATPSPVSGNCYDGNPGGGGGGEEGEREEELGFHVRSKSETKFPRRCLGKTVTTVRKLGLRLPHIAVVLQPLLPGDDAGRSVGEAHISLVGQLGIRIRVGGGVLSIVVEDEVVAASNTGEQGGIAIQDQIGRASCRERV